MAASLALAGCGDASVEFQCGADGDCSSLEEFLNPQQPHDAGGGGGLEGDAGGGTIVHDAGSGMVDTDGDGIPDSHDNCPYASNPDQADYDHNGVGDACDTGLIVTDAGSPSDAGAAPQDAGSPADAGTHDAGTHDAGTVVSDRDGDGVPDDKDGCPDDKGKTSPGVCGCGVSDKDSDGDGTPDCKDGCPSDKGKTSAGVCGCGVSDKDSDGDGIMDCKDNCPNKSNKDQADYNDDGQGDACTTQDGTLQHPFIISTTGGHQVFSESRNTANSSSSVFSTYPPNTTNESGKEYIYVFKITKPTYFSAEVKPPEPSGTDIDVHLFTNPSTSSPGLIERNDLAVRQKLGKGIYYLSLDGYSGKNGTYKLDVQFRPVDSTDLFNSYVLKAVDWTAKNYGKKGYASAALTHALPYGSDTISPTNAPYTMCVAAAMEIMLTAMRIYAEETGDKSVWNFLPASSWKSLSSSNIRAHIWCNSEIGTWGSADSLRHFGMGQNVHFSELKPGSFINLNRTSGTGHAVVFISYIDINGNDLSTYSDKVKGFRYFSSQGSQSNGGMDYRCAFFRNVTHGTISNGCRADTGLFEPDYSSPGQKYFNSGMMYMPSKWLKTHWVPSKSKAAGLEEIDILDTIESVFDETYFDGKTVGDDDPDTYQPPEGGEYLNAVRKGLIPDVQPVPEEASGDSDSESEGGFGGEE